MGTLRTLRVLLDSCAYSRDLQQLKDGGTANLHAQMNLLMRRSARQNNFKAVLATIRSLMNHPEEVVVPQWMHDLFLGYGDPKSCTYTRMESRLPSLDLRDTFLDEKHMIEAFPLAASVKLPEGGTGKQAYYRLDFSPPKDGKHTDGDLQKKEKQGGGDTEVDAEDLTRSHIKFSTYTLPNYGPYPECERKRNKIRCGLMIPHSQSVPFRSFWGVQAAFGCILVWMALYIFLLGLHAFSVSSSFVFQVHPCPSAGSALGTAARSDGGAGTAGERQD